MSYFRKPKKTLVDIDRLIRLEGNIPALNFRHSLNQLFAGDLSDAQLQFIAKDIATIEYWRGVYAKYVGREAKLLDDEPTLIKVYKPPFDGHYVFDGIHRLAAAKLAGLQVIGAKLAPMFLLD